MNIDQLKTVLELNRSRHFNKTADVLCVTQSTISARVNALEQELGCQLFKRTSRSVELTAAGQRFLVHAHSILAVWQRAKQDAASLDQSVAGLAVGGLFVLWDVLLQQWLSRLQGDFPNLNLIAQSHDHAYLIRQLVDGGLDLIFTFEPPQYQEIAAQEIFSLPLIMVSDQVDRAIDTQLPRDYIQVDWGESFDRQHAQIFPNQLPAQKRVNQARLALNMMLAEGGCAYLSAHAVARHLDQGQLFKVNKTPAINLAVYAVYLPQSTNLTFIKQSLDYFL